MKFRQLYIIWGLLLWVWQGFAQSSGSNELYIPEMQAVAGSTASIPVHLDNSDEVVAIEFELVFPDKTSPVLDTKGRLAVELSERMPSDVVGTYNRLSNNRYKLMVFSASNGAIGGVKGEILSFQVKIEDKEELIGQTIRFEITDIILVKKNAQKVDCALGETKVEIVRGNRPDLEVSGVSSTSAVVKPGEIVEANWLVRNIGNQPTKAGWKESVYLVGADDENEIHLGNLNYGEVLPANGQVSRSAEFRLNEYPGLDGNVRVKVKLTPNADAGELEADAANNTSLSVKSLNLLKTLTFRVAKNIVLETAGSGINCYVYRSGNRSTEESFVITNSNPSRLSVPESVLIPEGQSGASFSVKPIDDQKANPDSTAVITIQGNEYGEVKQTIRIEDDERPFLKLSIAENLEVAEGGTFQLKLEREWSIPWPLAVKLSSDHPKRFENFPSEVVIPANEKVVTVSIKVKDDDLPGLDDEVVFTASAPGHDFDLTSKRFVTVKDNDVPNITLELSTSTASEANQVVTATLKRMGVTDNKVTVNLTDDGNGRISLPSSIVLEAGVSEKEFAVRTVDNAMKDGDKTVKITGAIYISSCNCSTAGTKAGVFEKTLTVLDDDDANVTSVASKTALLEGETGKITVSINEVLSASLTIHLSCDNKEVELPSSAMIPAGKNSVEVDVKVLENNVTEGNRIATVVIDAGEYGKSTCWLNITDRTLPDAVVTTLRTENKISVSGSAKVSVTVKNEGVAPLSAQTKVSVYLSKGKDVNNSAIALGNLYTQSELAVGESVTLNKILTFPEKTGDYYLIAIVNEEQTKEELSYTNNTSAPFVLTLAPLYTVQVSLDKSVLKTGESVMVTGQITGSKTSGVPVDLYIINNGYRKVISVTADNAGVFQKSFTPESWQMGHFSVGACYPDEGLEKEMAGFDMYGLKKATDGMITWEVFTNEKKAGTIKLSNPGSKALSNITAKIVSQPQNCQIHFSSISTMAANGTAELQYGVTGTAVSPGMDWEPIKVQVASAEGAVLDLDIYYYCRSYAAQLEVSEPNINTTMTIGAVREYPITITNTGKGETGEISVVLPNAGWISLASQAKMPSLKYGESATVLLRLAPDKGMEANLAHKGQFAINCANGNGVPVSFRITPVSSENGTLIVDVCDEYTYYTAEKPHVSGAKVRVTRPNTNEVVAEGTTGSDGLFTKELPAGYYTLEVTADKHDSYKNTILVDPGKENKVVINLSFQAITYSWEVVETEVEDQYEIKTEVKYETNVPAPVLVVDFPDVLVLKDQVFQVAVRNEGLITAKNVMLNVPTIKGVGFDILTDLPEDLPAKKGMIVYIRMELIDQSLFGLESKKFIPIGSSSNIDKVGTDNDDRPESKACCFSAPFSVYGEYYCGELIRLHVGGSYDFGSCCPIVKNIVELKWPTVTSPFGKPGKVNGMNGYGSNTEISSAGFSSSRKCEINECLKKLLEKLRDCAIGFVPVVGCGWGLKQCHEAGQDGEASIYDKVGCISTAIGCMPSVPYPVSAGVNLGACLYSLTEPCPVEGSETKSGGSGYPSFVLEFQDRTLIYKESINAYNNIFKELFGAGDWTEATTEELQLLFSFLSAVEEGSLLNKNDQSLQEYRPQSVSVEDFYIFIDRINNTVLKESGKIVEGDYIDQEKLNQYGEIIDGYEKSAKEMGYVGLDDLWETEYKKLQDRLDDGESSASVCASVTLQFSQSMVMTRQAFRGTLSVFNGHESKIMKDVKLDLEVSDEDGIVATSHEFQINPETLDGFSGKLDGAWTLDAQKTGKATILFIPTKYAAPTEPKEYTFGGTLSYVDPFTNLEVTRDLFPVTMTVKPSPNLEMDYFMQRDILGDDPLTKDVVEPMIPSEFSLLIHNVGAGDAKNVRMTTKQPEITDNEKGLLVDFQIKTSQLNGEAETAVMGENVMTDFGTIESGKTAYAQWWLTSTLLGHFTDYKVEATHVTSYDNPDLSLLDTVRIHELIRGIRVDESASPKVTGFMVNDIPDAEDFPDMMHLTDGTVAPVVKAKSASAMPDGSGSTYTLTVIPSGSGWNYISIEDPTKGKQKLVSVDGNTNLDTRKVWQTDRTLRDGKDPKYEYLIHVVDYFEDGAMTRAASPGTFRLVFEERPETVLAVESITGLPEGDGVATSQVGTVTIKFNKAVSPDALNADVVTLYYQGEKVETEGLQFKQQGEDTYTLDLSTLTKQNGVYTLMILTSEIKDANGFAGEEDYSVVWNQQAEGKVSLTAFADPEKAGTVTPASIQVGYGEETDFVAKANNGYRFKTWTINDRTVSTEATYSHTAIVDQTLVANFDPISYKIEISYDASRGFVTFGTGYYEFDSSLELIATPNDGYRFAGWFIGGNRVSTEERFIYKVIGDTKLEARFEATGGGPDDPDNPEGEDPDNPNNPDNPDGGDPDDPTANGNVETLVIQVYPTRVADYVHVGVLPAKSRLVLFDFTGKQVKQVSSCEGDVDLFMGDQPSGFYLLHILAGEEQKKTVKLIKK